MSDNEDTPDTPVDSDSGIVLPPTDTAGTMYISDGKGKLYPRLNIQDHWIKSYWRPAMGWLYMVICFMDFVGFPLLSMLMPLIIKGTTYVVWTSITLSNGGMVHMAFGAILGVAAWTRGMEKVRNNDGQ